MSRATVYPKDRVIWELLSVPVGVSYSNLRLPIRLSENVLLNDDRGASYPTPPRPYNATLLCPVVVEPKESLTALKILSRPIKSGLLR